MSIDGILTRADTQVPQVKGLVLGHGIDLVFVPDFAEQLHQPGSVFAKVFTDREWGRAQRRPDPVASLAARWAAKEAVVKAWSSALFGMPPPLSEPGEVSWRDSHRSRVQQGGSHQNGLHSSGFLHAGLTDVPLAPVKKFSWREIELVSDLYGRPSVGFTGEVLSALKDLAHADWWVSLSHDGDYAAASVIASSNTSARSK
ncbi:holo-ACP synthase [Gleimia hominis]|uniref:holo-ACP synthase n=1 Tax=Gleimia hominis TaxID=595468 RepID=UPI001E3AB01F|nr:holo-ACP synthase [Gleimia hominis]WIK64413.1 holo-ACP synthase [Gleimia hominis]